MVSQLFVVLIVYAIAPVMIAIIIVRNIAATSILAAATFECNGVDSDSSCFDRVNCRMQVHVG